MNNGLLNLIGGIIKKGGFSYILLFLCLLFCVDSRSVYLVLLFGVLNIPLLRKEYTNEVIWIILFSVTYCLFDYNLNGISSNTKFLSNLLCPVTFFLCGVKISKNFQFDVELPVALLILTISLLAQVVYATINGIITIGLVDVTRDLYIADEEDATSSTIFGLIISPALGFLTLPFISKKRNGDHIWVWLFMILSVLALLTTIHVVNRGGLTIALVGVFASLAWKYKNKKFLFILASIFVIFLIFRFIPENGEVYDAYAVRNQGSADGYRIERWTIGLSNLFKYPFGGGVSHFYYHNLWLDVARVSGVIPFFILIIPTIMIIRKTLKIFFSSESLTSCILGLMFLTLFISCFMEPALEARALMVFFFFFLGGVISGTLKYNKNEQYSI